jgi:hypothetical protein
MQYPHLFVIIPLNMKYVNIVCNFSSMPNILQHSSFCTYCKYLYIFRQDGVKRKQNASNKNMGVTHYKNGTIMPKSIIEPTWNKENAIIKNMKVIFNKKNGTVK